MSSSLKKKFDDPFHPQEEILLEKALGFDCEEEEEEEDEKDALEDGMRAPPVDGFDHLRRVKREARRLEEVKIATNADELLLKKSAYPLPSDKSRDKPSDLPPKFVPSVKWQDEQVKRFSDLRMKLERNQAYLVATKMKEEEDKEDVGSKAGEKKKVKFPQREDEKGWCLFAHGQATWDLIVKARTSKSSPGESESSDNELESSSKKEEEEAKKKKKKHPDFVPETPDGQPPLVGILLQMKSNVSSRLFEFHVDWVESLERVPSEFGPWIYALMSRLEKPLYPDVGSALRTLALVCSRQRLRVVKKESDGEGGLEIVNMLTLFVCLVARYFNQLDLAD